MQHPGPLPWYGQQLAVRLHLVDFSGQFGVSVDDQSASLSVIHQSLFSLAKLAHQGDHFLPGKVQLRDGRRVGDGVPVDPVVTEGFTHALLLDEGWEDLFVAVNDVQDASGWWDKNKQDATWDATIFY